MDNQNPQLSTGTSGEPQPQPAALDSDFVANPSYQVPSVTPSVSDFVDNPNYKQPDNKQPSALGSIATGAGKEFMHTVGGIYDLASKIPGVKNTLDEADKIAGFSPQAEQNMHATANTPLQGTGEDIGGGMESIAEFLTGDEALKGLSIADKLTQVSKLMKYVENFPRLEQALRLGINVGKAGAELSPEERGMLQAHPVLARLVGVGLDALRQGGVQAGQTELKSGGNATPGEIAKSAAEMAGGSAAIGAPLGIIGGLVAKGGEGAANAAKLNEAALHAPTATEANAQLGMTAQNALQPAIESAQAAKDEAEEKLAGAGGAVEGVIKGAPTKADIVTNAQAHAQQGEQAIRDAYTSASEALRNDPALAGLTIPGTGSAFQKAAENAAFGETEGDAVRKALGAAIPASPDVMKLATNLAKPKGLLDLDEAGNPKEMNVNNLLDYAKDIKERLRKTGYSTPQDMRDRHVLYSLLDGAHQSLNDLMNKSGNPELINNVLKMNQDYKEGIQTFKNPDVQKILQGTNENAIIGTLTGGKSVGDIQSIKKAIGQKAFSALSDDAMSRLAADSTDPATGQLDMKRWVRNMTNIPADVRAEMFNDTIKSGALENVLKQVQQVQGSGVIEKSDNIIKESEKTMHDILGGNSNLVGLTKSPEKVQQLEQLIGPEAMGELGNTILMNQLREASTKVTKSGVKIGSTDTGQFLRFIESLKDSPEVVDAFFKPTPERAAAYEKLLNSVHNVEGVKNMVKIGLVAPTLGAAVGGAVGHSVFSAILGSMAAEGAGGYFSKARDFLDTIANHPATWKTLGALSKGAASSTAKSAANVAKILAGKGLQSTSPYLKQIYNQTSPSLGGKPTNQGNSFFESAGSSLEPGELGINAVKLPKEIESLVDKYAHKYKLPTNLARAVIFHESRGNPHAVGKPTSNGQAKGLGQLLPGTAQEMGIIDPFNPDQNLNGAMKYLSKLYTQHNKNPLLAYAAYTAGPNRVKSGDTVQDVLKKLPSEGQKGVRKVAQLLGIDVDHQVKQPSHGITGAW